MMTRDSTFRWALGIGAFLVLASCASLSEDQCRAGDWFAIGQNDGAQGRSLSHFTNHARACNEYGIAPNQTQWVAGREAGLPLYCTAENAYSVGRSGRTLNNVCPVADLAVLERANFRGLRYHDIGDEIREAERELDEVRDEIAGLAPEDEGAFRTLRRISRTLRLRIQRLRLEQLRYATY